MNEVQNYWNKEPFSFVCIREIHVTILFFFFFFAAITWLKYFWFGVKHYPINQFFFLLSNVLAFSKGKYGLGVNLEKFSRYNRWLYDTCISDLWQQEPWFHNLPHLEAFLFINYLYLI